MAECEVPDIETERLQIRALTEQDAGFILELLNDEGWLKHIGDRNIHSHEDALRYLREGPLASYRQHHHGLMAVCLKTELHTPIGICGLLKRDDLEFADLGYALLGSYTRKGYGYESSVGVMRDAKERLAMSRLYAFTSDDNERSLSLLTRLGFEFVRHQERGDSVVQILQVVL